MSDFCPNLHNTTGQQLKIIFSSCVICHLTCDHKFCLESRKEFPNEGGPTYDDSFLVGQNFKISLFM